MIRWLAIGLAAVVVLGLGCDRADPSPEQHEAATLSEQWPQKPRRIVSMAPNITELLFELGLGDRVVAVTRYCDWPPDVEGLPTIGGMLDPDLEAILAAEPDVVLGVEDGADHRVIKQFDRSDVAYGFVQMDDLETIRAGVEQLGAWLGVEDRAAELIQTFDKDLQQSSSSVRRAIGDDGATALLVFDREPIVVAGPGSFGHELLELAGLENAMGDSAGAYPVLDVEKVLALNPSFIIDVTIEAGDNQVVLEFWRQFTSLQAVENDGVVHIDDPIMMRPGPRLPKALDRLGQAVNE